MRTKKQETKREQRILRVMRMEALYDRLAKQLETTPITENGLTTSNEQSVGTVRLPEEEEKELAAAYEELISYYDSGLWLQDYEADERGELPVDLKRGVLSQDGLYQLLCDREESERQGAKNDQP